jgi:hypothetical protein
MSSPAHDAPAGRAAPATEGSLLLKRSRFLAETSRLLARSLDHEATLATVARLAMLHSALDVGRAVITREDPARDGRPEGEPGR